MKYTHSLLGKIIVPFLIVGVFLVSFGAALPKVVMATGTSECDDGDDNDSDGLIDYPSDTDCSDYYGSESSVAPVYSAPATTRPNDISGPDRFIYRAPGIYTLAVPNGVEKVEVTAWGAGGGGGSGQKTSNHHISGFGGGAGGYAVGEMAVTGGDVINVIVGAGGLQGEGGGLSEANIEQASIAGAGGGGGGVSMGGPGYKGSGGSGLLGVIATIVVAAVLTYISAGVLSGLASSLTSTFGAGASASATVGAGTTIMESVGVVAGSGLGGAGAGTSMMGAYTIAATHVATVGGTVVGGGTLTTVVTGSTAALGGSMAAGAAKAQVVGVAAQQASQRDPRVPGGIDGLSGWGFGAVRAGDGAGIGGSWVTGAPASSQPVGGTGGDGYAGYFLTLGGSGGGYSSVGGNPYASSGGSSPMGGAGGSRGRFGRDGIGSGSPGDARAQDGGFPGGGGGGSDTGTGGYGGDGQVEIEFTRMDGPIPQCRDGIDNDGDGLIDFPIDPGCADIEDDDETDIPPATPTLSLTCPTTLKTSETGQFSALASYSDNRTENISFNYDWGDGGNSTVAGLSGQNAVASKSWSSVGTKIVKVTVASVDKTCEVQVLADVGGPSVTLLANPLTVDSGQSSTLSWVALNSTSCMASGDWTGSKNTLDSEGTGPLTSQKTYTLTCKDDDQKSDSKSVTVAINSIGNGITYISVPAVVAPSSTFSVQVKNTGTKTWGSSHDLAISNQSKDNNLSLSSLSTTLPSLFKTVYFTAPAVAGNYFLRAVEQNVEWFGVDYPFTVSAIVPQNSLLSTTLSLSKTLVSLTESVTASSIANGEGVRYHGLEQRFKSAGGSTYGEWQNVGIWCQNDPSCQIGATRTKSLIFPNAGSYELRTYASKADMVAAYSPVVTITSSIASQSPIVSLIAESYCIVPNSSTSLTSTVSGSPINSNVIQQDTPAENSENGDGTFGTIADYGTQGGQHGLNVTVGREGNYAYKALVNENQFSTITIRVAANCATLPPITPNPPAGQCTASWNFSSLYQTGKICYSSLGTGYGGQMSVSGSSVVSPSPSSYTAFCNKDGEMGIISVSIPVICPGGGGGGTPPPPTPPQPDFTLSATPSVLIQVIPTVGGTSRAAAISIGPMNNFNSNIVLTVTPPSGWKTVEYSWNGGVFSANQNFTVSGNGNGYPNTSLALRVTGNDGARQVNITATGGGKTRLTSFLLDVNKTDTHFEEI